MKIINSLILDKYSNAERYTVIEDCIYKDITGGVGGSMGITNEPVYCVTLYSELEENEDTQYPLEDILDKHYVNCTDVMEEKIEDGKRVFIFEVEGESLESIKEIAELAGKRVFNYEEGAYIKLGVE